MEVDAEMRRKIVASTAAVLVFVAALVVVGTTFNADGLSETGGYALIGTLVLFVIIMALVGLFLDRE